MPSKEQKSVYNKNYKEKNPEKYREINSTYYRNNKDKFKKSVESARIKRLYNITPEQLEQMKIAQDNLCAICGQSFVSKYGMHIDHSHSTGKVRALLCRHCNIAIGMFKDNFLVIEKALAYLKKWQ